jgi:hypothetical protein
MNSFLGPVPSIQTRKLHVQDARHLLDNDIAVEEAFDGGGLLRRQQVPRQQRSYQGLHIIIIDSVLSQLVAKVTNGLSEGCESGRSLRIREQILKVGRNRSSVGRLCFED